MTELAEKRLKRLSVANWSIQNRRQPLHRQRERKEDEGERRRKETRGANHGDSWNCFPGLSFARIAFLFGTDPARCFLRHDANTSFSSVLQPDLCILKFQSFSANFVYTHCYVADNCKLLKKKKRKDDRDR